MKKLMALALTFALALSLVACGGSDSSSAAGGSSAAQTVDWESSERIQKIKYPMLADPTHSLAEDFQVYIEADGLAERGSFIVNPEGRIVAYEVTAGNVGRNADELLRRVQASQFVHEHGDEVCPAKWEPGAETLKPSLDLVGQL